METGNINQLMNCKGEINAIDYTGERKIIKRLEPEEAFETLGVYLAPSGNQEKAYSEMKSKATQWAERICTSFL